MLGIACALSQVPPDQPIQVLTDSNVALAAFERCKNPHYSYAQRLVNMGYRSAFMELQHALSLRTAATQVVKIPAHSGILGNEAADALARLGCSLPPSDGPRPSISPVDLQAVLFRNDSQDARHALECSAALFLRRRRKSTAFSNWSALGSQGIWAQQFTKARANHEWTFTAIKQSLQWSSQRRVLIARLACSTIRVRVSLCPFCSCPFNSEANASSLLSHAVYSCPFFSPERNAALEDMDRLARESKHGSAAASASDRASALLNSLFSGAPMPVSNLFRTHSARLLPNGHLFEEWREEFGWTMWAGLIPNGPMSSWLSSLDRSAAVNIIRKSLGFTAHVVEAIMRWWRLQRAGQKGG